MKALLICACLIGGAAPVFAGDVGVSVTVGQPGFYGRIDVGSYPQPMIVYPQPIVIVRAPVAVVAEPIYLRVPPGHAKHWAKHCGKYNACGQPVFFVQEGWYQSVYAPSYRDRGGPGRHDDDRDDGDRKQAGKHKEKHKGKGKDKDKD